MSSTTMRMFPCTLSRREKSHILMSLSGVMYTPVDKITEQGYDMQFGTNVLGACTEVTCRKTPHSQ